MLVINPKDRVSASEALKHPWFNQDENEANQTKINFALAQEEEKN